MESLNGWDSFSILAIDSFLDWKIKWVGVHWENYISICFHIEWDMMEPNGIPFGSKSKGKLSPRSYPIQCERKWKYNFLSLVEILVEFIIAILCHYLEQKVIFVQIAISKILHFALHLFCCEWLNNCFSIYFLVVEFLTRSLCLGYTYFIQMQ